MKTRSVTKAQVGWVKIKFEADNSDGYVDPNELIVDDMPLKDLINAHRKSLQRSIDEGAVKTSLLQEELSEASVEISQLKALVNELKNDIVSLKGLKVEV
jgi:hypothetical protein